MQTAIFENLVKVGLSVQVCLDWGLASISYSNPKGPVRFRLPVFQPSRLWGFGTDPQTFALLVGGGGLQMVPTEYAT